MVRYRRIERVGTYILWACWANGSGTWLVDIGKRWLTVSISNCIVVVSGAVNSWAIGFLDLTWLYFCAWCSEQWPTIRAQYREGWVSIAHRKRAEKAELHWHADPLLLRALSRRFARLLVVAAPIIIYTNDREETQASRRARTRTTPTPASRLFSLVSIKRRLFHS